MTGHAVTDGSTAKAREAFLAKLAAGYSVKAAVSESAMSRAWSMGERWPRW